MSELKDLEKTLELSYKDISDVERKLDCSVGGWLVVELNELKVQTKRVIELIKTKQG